MDPHDFYMEVNGLFHLFLLMSLLLARALSSSENFIEVFPFAQSPLPGTD